MEAHHVTPENMHLAVALLLQRQGDITLKFTTLDKRLDDQDVLLTQIRDQTLKTNGGLIHAKADIVQNKQDISEVRNGLKVAIATGGCPGKCIPLEEKVRELQDAQLTQAATVKGATFAVRILWATGAGFVAVAGWLIGKGVVKAP